MVSPGLASETERGRRGAEALAFEARNSRLATQPQWLRLGHYRRTVGGRWVSEVDGPAFFLSPGGKTDPQAELEATIRSLFAHPKGPSDDSHVLCAFPARTAWLARELSIDPDDMPRVKCPGFSEFLEKLSPVSVTFIFSSYYLNNPVSAFGHTFLRVNSEASAGAPSRSELLDYGVDYSAATGRDSAIVYAFKGLFGMFPGVFNAMPYFYKVRKYNDMESRDIWEYELSLTREETQFLVRHLWELGRTYIDYWYLTENCSYHILGLLEAAKPDSELLSKVSKPVLPANTVKAVVDVPGLVSRIRYRPSIRSQFRQRIKELDREQLDLVARIADHPDAPMSEHPAGETSKVYDAAMDLVEMRHFRELITDPAGLASQLKQRIMERRAVLGVMSPALALQPGLSRMPHSGHDSRRVGLGFGHSTEDGDFAEVSFRVALHDLLDPPSGYPETSQIEFLPVRLRYSTDESRIHLEEGYAVRVLSLSPRDMFEKSYSWKVAAGATRIHDSGCPGACTAAHVGAGVGLAWAWRDEATVLFSTVDADLLATPALEGGLGDGPVRAGVGPSVGLRLRPGPSIVGLLSMKWSFLPGQHPVAVWKVESGVRWSMKANLALGVQAAAFPDDASAGLFLHCYF